MAVWSEKKLLQIKQPAVAESSFKLSVQVQPALSLVFDIILLTLGFNSCI